MGSLDDWAQLLQALRSRYVVGEPAEGRIAVTSRYRVHGPVAVELVMTPRDWADLVSMPFGDLDLAINYALAEVAAAPPATPYLVYHLYELVPSSTPELPPDPDDGWGGPQSGPPHPE